TKHYDLSLPVGKNLSGGRLIVRNRSHAQANVERAILPAGQRDAGAPCACTFPSWFRRGSRGGQASVARDRVGAVREPPLRKRARLWRPATAMGKRQLLTLQPALAGDRIAYSGQLFLSPLPGLVSCSASSSHGCRHGPHSIAATRLASARFFPHGVLWPAE